MNFEVVYKDRLTTLIQGDAKEVSGLYLRMDHGVKNAVLVTDPVWPDCPEGLLVGWDQPYELAEKVFTNLQVSCKAMIVQLGQFSDPRLLRAVPDRFDFYSAVQCSYGKPSYSGTKLKDCEIAYVFGDVDPPLKKLHPGRIVYNYNKKEPSQKQRTIHPCPRRMQHLRGLLTHFARHSVVLDPFCGGGTTLMAARELGIPAIGIEIVPEYISDILRQLNTSNTVVAPLNEPALQPVELFTKNSKKS